MNDTQMFWMVWNPDNGETHHKHGTQEAAEREAERLASINAGRRFYVLRAEGYALTPKATTYHRLDDIPF